MRDDWKRVRAIANYQFGRGAGSALFPDEPEIRRSRTGRIRQIFYRGERIATLKTDGLFTLSIEGATRLHHHLPYPKMRVVVEDDAAPFVRDGKNVFARHVVEVDDDLRAFDEVLVVDRSRNLLGTGKAVLSACEMLSFMRGVAVDVRSGVGGVE
ncbi:MAG: pseudouridine synthase [Candidatus Syntrophoarchaeum sp.]|nr:pseudouridine synthase [Candidatus Syntrophoarchaeum sp.]